MSELIVLGFDDEYKAEEARLDLARMQVEHLVDLEDAAVVVKNKEGKVKLKQAVDLTATGAVSGSFWGLLIGTLFLMPILGAAVGAASGAIGGALSDIGVNDQFMKQLAESMQPGTSALFVLVRKATPEKVLPELAKYHATVLRTSLSPDAEKKLQDALSGTSATPATAS